jgi:hypothetical protein
MKRNKLVVLLLLLAVIIMCSAAPARAQENKTAAPGAGSGAGCFDGSSKLLNIGLGIGGVRYYNYGRSGPYKYSRTPAFSISYEQALAEKVGPGYIGLGGYLGFQHASYRYDLNGYYYNYQYNDYYYKHSWNYFLLTARGTYHLDVLNWEKGEVYFGTMLGLRIQTYKFTTNNPDPAWNNAYRLHESSANLIWSVFAGGRYYFTDNVAGFMELGYGVSYLTVGATIKL